jgi:phage repressor protein C with HTH and peptisase S24 domain
MILGRRIKQLRLEKNLTQKELAKRSGLHWTSISSYERNLETPSYRTIVKLAEGLRVEPEALFREPDVEASIPVFNYTEGGVGIDWDDGGLPVSGAIGLIPRHEIKDPNAYALVVASEGLLPRFKSGEKIVVAPSFEAKNGQDCVVKMKTGEVRVKQVYFKEKSRVVLRSYNPAVGDEEFEEKDFVFIVPVVRLDIV